MPHFHMATLGFQGFPTDSLWFPPVSSSGSESGEKLLAVGGGSARLAQNMLSTGCSMAKKSRPDLAAELDALSKAGFAFDLFQWGDGAAGQGWFRFVAQAPGASAEALEACEAALGAARAPLLSAHASGALAAFGRGDSDEVPNRFLASSIKASAKITDVFERADARLADADLILLRSADGTRQLTACLASCAPHASPHGLFSSMAKIAQAGIEARRALPPGSADAFFDAFDGALGASASIPMAETRAVPLPPGLFFQAPGNLRAMEIATLPSAGFDEACNALLPALARRFGPLAAAPRAICGPGPAADWRPSCAELASLGGLFAKLGPAPEPPTPAAGQVAGPIAPERPSGRGRMRG